MSHKEHPPWYAPIVHFATHAVVGSIIFIIVGTPSVLLGWLVHKLRDWGVSEVTLTILQFLEYAILIMDAILFLAFLGFTTWSAIKELKNE
ncbi:hypothetical protein ACK249_005158 [Pseudomonas aeruginosa]|uniref:Transmembrane protein n=1 Tax=Pseudomonas aeruginosa TaxID=287 RepID=A0A241XS98_PSEAI|nr:MULTISPECIES: hypothetical protein [Pseudomonas]EKW9640704.1 hypothetical protein [Pseudomonas aeruginosa]MBH4100069.1 hypothetical protein [Pseudomonas aeruginosa]MBI6604952.1 hypothetical protein [Pseudomonas sp. S4_EA_1b]MBI8852569.1 hypothetical protein [Pseudomonas aeruginosa]MBW6127216.1 hypothetical protein [Pseudomonas aeruginosa]